MCKYICMQQEKQRETDIRTGYWKYDSMSYRISNINGHLNRFQIRTNKDEE
jgi:hypothetical protein